MLLAQLAATAKYDPFDHATDWYKFFEYVLTNIGWSVTQFTLSEWTPPHSRYTVAADVVKVLLDVVTADESSLVLATLDALGRLEDDDERIVLFEQQSHSLHSGSFRLAVSGQDTAGNAILKLAPIHFESTQSVDNLLFFRFSSTRTKVYAGVIRTAALNDAVYRQVRATILQKLGERLNILVKSIDLSSNP